MEKYQTAGRLITLSLVTSLQERQQHWQFALQFLFAALHGQQPQPLFRAQAPLHGQETSTDPWSYLTRMANFNLKKIDKWMKTWWINIFTFFEMLAKIFAFLFSNNRAISVYCLGIYKSMDSFNSMPLNRIILTSSSNSSEKTQKAFRDNVTR